MSVKPGCVVSHFLVGISVAVRFLIGLIHYVYTPAVAEFVKILAVGIMAGAKEIDVGLFHQAEILFIGGVIDVSAGYGMMVMTVHTTQLDISSVNFENLTYALYAFYPKMIVKMLNCGIVFTVKQFN